MRTLFVRIITVSWLLILGFSLTWPGILWISILLVPITVTGFYDMYQTKHALRRTFPLVGRGRWVMEFLRPFVRQYFFESETDGVPINRMFRSVIYQRAKGQTDTIPYGTKIDTRAVGYEWIGHSMAAIHLSECAIRPSVKIGGPNCVKPYQAAILNVSAMSFGSLSANAILALNKGAKLGGFYHNTGEGSISPYHLKHGGDIVWQIGTGYFGCRDDRGRFCAELFAEKASQDSVKMIEIKLSQGAKPGHGGILPADKNTIEIAQIRHVEPGVRVDSPPSHSAFKTPLEMMGFIEKLRELSGGKPVGFKLAVGRKSEFIALCKAMVESGIKPDFITVDGGEGGTGAAPLEYSNSVGMPLQEAIVFIDDALTGFDLRKDIKVIASAKVFTGFHVIRSMALGADLCNSARGMMVALGCVQSLVCNNNECPTGIATQDAILTAGLVVDDKAGRVARYQAETVKATMELVAPAGLRDPAQITRSHIYRRVSQTEIKRFDQIYPGLVPGSLLAGDYPERFAHEMAEASSQCFMPSNFVIECFGGLEKLPD